jgi:hypothetical protein
MLLHTDVVRYLPRADVALPMPIRAIAALRSKKNNNNNKEKYI